MKRLAQLVISCALVASAALTASATPLNLNLRTAEMDAAREPEDACGGRKIYDAAVPDGPFLEACRTHDACYRSDLYDQRICDRLFLSEMREGCEMAYPDEDKPIKHHACRTVALTYFKAVNSRFGSYAYSSLAPSGGVLWYEQIEVEEKNGKGELQVCLEFENTAKRIQGFKVRLHDSANIWVDTEPNFSLMRLQPGETRALCIDSNNAPHRDWVSMGDHYTVTLLVDNPDRLGIFDGDLPVARLNCDKTTGRCIHTAL